MSKRTRQILAQFELVAAERDLAATEDYFSHVNDLLANAVNDMERARRRIANARSAMTALKRSA